MPALWIFGILTLLVVASAGLTLLKAGRDLDAGDGEHSGGVAGLVDSQLVRARTAVDVLIQPEVEPHEVRPMSTPSHRGEAYVMVGVGLLGIVAFVVVGLVLLAG